MSTFSLFFVLRGNHYRFKMFLKVINTNKLCKNGGDANSHIGQSEEAVNP